MHKKNNFPQRIYLHGGSSPDLINAMNGVYLFGSLFFFFFFAFSLKWKRTALLCAAVCFVVVNTTTSHWEGRSKAQNGSNTERCQMLYFITQTNSSPASIGDTGTLSLQIESIANSVLNSKMDLEEPGDNSLFKTDVAKKVLLLIIHLDTFLLRG